MATIIHHNGRRDGAWRTDPESVGELIRLIETEPLVPSLAPYLAPSPRTPGMVQVFGNFVTVSHAFLIETDEEHMIAKFREAFKKSPPSE